MKGKIRKFESKLTGAIKDFKLTKKEIRNGYVYAFYCAVSGYPEVLEFKCKIPAGYTDLDLNTLKDDCLTGANIPPNKEALIK